MDIEKVLGIFEEVLGEEEKHNIISILNELLNNLNANNLDAVDEIISKINEYSKQSIINEYAFSKLKLLERINATNYFGIYLKKFIDDLFTKETYKIKENLSQFIKQRNEFLTNLKNNVHNLENLDFESYYDNIETFELGLIIPKNQSELKKIQHYLKEWHFVLKHVSELCEEEYSEPKIYSVSDSSLGIFFLCSFPVVKCVLILTKDVLDIYKKVLDIKRIRKSMEKYDLKFKDGIKEASNIEKTIVNEEKENIVKKIISQYGSKASPERKKELETSIRKSVETIIKMQDDGILIESTPPKIKEPEILEEGETEENKEERNKVEKEYNHMIKENKEITGVFANIAKVNKELTFPDKCMLRISQYLDKETKQELKKGEEK